MRLDRRQWMARGLAGAAALAAAGGVGARPHPGAPSLEGAWTLGSYTDFQRPKELHTLVLTPAEAEAYEAPRRALRGMIREKDDELGQTESEFNERGAALGRVNGQIRSSWIAEPADGNIPYTAEARVRLGLDRPKPPERWDNPEDLNGPTRCLTNQAAGAPMLGAPDANLFQIVQTPGAVAILTEKYHEVRVVSLDANLKPAAAAGAWIGDSVGHWEGPTLVVETAGFHAGDITRGGGLHLSEHSRVTERFTRAGPDALFYQFAVEDPTLFTQVWRGEMTLDKAKGRIFEFACHEGNYSLPGILAGSRRLDREGKAAAPETQAKSVP